MLKLTPAEQRRRDRENEEAQARRNRAWHEEHAELVRRGLAEPLDDFTQRRRALAQPAPPGMTGAGCAPDDYPH